MEVTEIKTALHQKIDSADADQLREIYGLINNYISGSDDWDTLTGSQKAQLLKGLEQADAGIGKTLTDINKRLKTKYGING